jgi:outer membrane protein OmpA-like peptidoglycan-associated protein
MSRLLIALLSQALVLQAMTFAPTIYAQDADFCQTDDTACKPCDNKDGSKDKSCQTVHGKRIDNGDSLGARSVPPSDGERHLVTETFTLSDEAPASSTDNQTQQFENVEKTDVKKMTTSDVNPMFVSGDGNLTDRIKDELAQIAAKVKGKQNIKVEVVGHTDNQGLSARNAKIYKDNYGLGLARANNAAAFLANELAIPLTDIQTASKADTEPVDSNSAEHTMAKNRRIEIKISYDEATTTTEKVALPMPVAAPAASLTSCDNVLATRTRAAVQPYRISVDGVPIADTGTIDPDIQRCTDIALEKTDIQVRYDSLETTPWLNVSANNVAAIVGKPVTFNGYSNYRYWITKAEVRLFNADDTSRHTPLAVLPLDDNWQATWTADNKQTGSVNYVLRVYDKDGKFDETKLQPLTITTKKAEPDDIESAGRENLIGYGENILSLHNIVVSGGAVTANGLHLAEGNQVRFLGELIPVDKNGRFAARQILPAGNHVVDVEVLDAAGANLMKFNRNLYIPDKDWFYIALGDITAGRNSTSGPAKLVTGDDQHFDNSAYIDGRLAFYLKGKVKGDWLLTASADTREQPLQNLFKNFDEKDPMYLIRRLDPDRYYPVYGDDSTTVEDAPTRGKFFVRLEKGDSQVMWGSFQTQLAGADLVQFSRGMYGANVRWRGEDSTDFGEKKTKVDLFAGDPGTLGAREQFRGTGGSLYYIQHQDVTRGSEKLWVEVRDKDSGIVLDVTQLTFGQDYDFDPIQGRILLTKPLASTADDKQLVRTGSLSGHPVFLLATYEYSPSIFEIDNVTTGGRVSQWLGEKVQIGATGYRQGDKQTRQNIVGFDATYRVAPGVYIKGETARSDGLGTTTQSSATGGFEFNGISTTGGVAHANRVEGAVDLAELGKGKGKISAYWQDRDKGFSSPGQQTSENIEQTGFNVDMAITDKASVQAKADIKNADNQDSKAISGALKLQVTPKLSASVGLRHDDLDTKIANASPTLSQNGKRDDATIQLEYIPNPDETEQDWKVYGYAQGTINSSGNRNNNDRIGAGGEYQLTQRLKLNGEISEGRGGVGGIAGADWRVNDRSQIYMNYALDTDRTDSLYRGRQGTWVAGTRTRYSDNMNIFAEERASNGSGISGLTHAFGLDLAAQDGWNFGFKGEVGNLSDPLAGDYDRKSASFSVGRSIEKIKYAGNIEWRNEGGTQLGDRTTWLMRNSLSYQTTADWRMLGKFNFSRSNSSKGSAFDADFSEAVFGYAYRPVLNDKFNALFKYTYFDNLPSPAALSTSGVVTDYAQKSHVLSVDAIYDIKPWLSIGGKYGFRKSEVKFGRTDGNWESSDANLLIGRLDWHFVHDWDALLEARYLDVQAASDSRTGYLAAVYRHINNNIKAGAGFNFTDYSDDLTDQSYKSRGFFINVISKF